MISERFTKHTQCWSPRGSPFCMKVSWHPGFTSSMGSTQQDSVLGFQKTLTYSAHFPWHTSPHPPLPSSWQDLGLPSFSTLKTSRCAGLVNLGLHYLQSQGWEFSSTLKEADHWCFSLISPKATGKQDAQAGNKTRWLRHFPVQVRLHHKPSSWESIGTICLHNFPAAGHCFKAKTVPCRNLLLGQLCSF